MKIIHNNLYKLSLAILLTVLFVTSCNEDKFLTVPRTDKLSGVSFPSTVSEFNFLLHDLYGRLRNTMYLSFDFPHLTWARGHEVDLAHPAFSTYSKMDMLPSDGRVEGMWNNYYANIARTNDFLSNLDKIKASGNLSETDVSSLDKMEGQARFIRAFNYFHLITLYGETSVATTADLSKMGVIIHDKIAASEEETSKPRSTIGEVYTFIKNDLTESANLLNDVEWTGADGPRVTEWAAKGLLGKTQLYSLDFAGAAQTFKDVIDNSGKKLVSYDVLKDMFNAMHEGNEESLFELYFNDSKIGEWNTSQQTSHFLGIFISPAFLNNDRKYSNEGFGNLFIHDKNLVRYGYDYPTPVDQNALKDGDVWKSDDEINATLADYLDHAETIREDKTVDPRLFVTALQPYYDSVIVGGVNRAVIKNQGEGPNLTNNFVWAIRKYAPISKGVWTDGANTFANNINVLRMADVYLMYAEALINSGGDQAVALEYINKVKRRAYDLPVDAASAVDYASLTSATLANDPVLVNNPLRYERWAEFQLEGLWFFDVGRWKLGAQEAAYYQKVTTGNLTWNDRMYTLPLPEVEIVANEFLVGKQNPGY